jgi:hypothetical protein
MAKKISEEKAKAVVLAEMKRLSADPAPWVGIAAVRGWIAILERSEGPRCDMCAGRWPIGVTCPKCSRLILDLAIDGKPCGEAGEP